MFTGKVVWITGASSGIGEAVAVEFAKQKASLILSARRIAELERVKNICDNYTAQVEILPFDLKDIHAFSTVAEKAVACFNRIDILINNGGISQRSLASESPLQLDRTIMEVNYFANIALTKCVLPGMLKNNAGHIVVISSLSGKFGFPMRSAYSASKFALHGFYESLRAENKKHGIHILLVCPGRIKTNISCNALTKDNTPHNKMDEGQENGIPAQRCAHIILSAIKKNKKEIIIARKEKILLFARKYFPSLFYYLSVRIDPEK